MLYNCTASTISDWSFTQRNGKIIAAYISDFGTFQRLSYSTLLSNGTCADTTIVREANGIQYSQINFFNDTAIALSWLEASPTPKLIYQEINLYTKYSSSNTTLCNAMCYPKLSSNNLGTIISWSQDLGGGNASFSVRQNYGNTAKYSAQVSGRGSSVASTSVNTVLAWTEYPNYSQNTNNAQLKLQVFNSALQPTTSPITMTPSPIIIGKDFSLALGDNIAAIVSRGYVQSSLDLDEVFINFFNLTSGNTFGYTQLNKYITNNQDFPAVSFNQGVFATAWQSDGQDGSRSGIYGRLFFANGTAITTNEFKVNQITAGDQLNVKIVPKGDSFIFGFSSQGLIALETVDVSQYITKKIGNKTATEEVRNHFTDSETVTSTSSREASLSNSTSDSSTILKPRSESISGSFSASSQSISRSFDGSTESHTLVTSPTASHSASPVIKQEGKQNSVPQPASAVPTIAKEIVASSVTIASVATVSPTNVALGVRISTLQKISQCESNYQDVTFPQPSVWEHPLRFGIGEDKLSYVKGAFVGNIILYIGGAFVIAGALGAGAWGLGALGVTAFAGVTFYSAATFTLPTIQAISAAYFFPQIVSSSVTLIRYGDELGWQIAGGTAIGLSLFHSFYYAYFLDSLKATYSVKIGKWIPPLGELLYVAKYGVRFEDYTDSKLEAFPVENLFNVATGAITGYSPNELAECSTMKYLNLGLNALNFAYLLIRRPYASIVNNIFYGSAFAVLTTASVIEVVQDKKAELKDHEDLNTLKEYLLLGANGALTLKGLFDIGMWINDIRTHGYRPMPVDPNSDTGASLLSTPEKAASAAHHVAVDMSQIAADAIELVGQQHANPLVPAH